MHAAIRGRTVEIAAGVEHHAAVKAKIRPFHPSRDEAPFRVAEGNVNPLAGIAYDRRSVYGVISQITPHPGPGHPLLPPKRVVP